MLLEIQKKIETGQSVSRSEAAYLYTHASDDDLARMSMLVKKRFHLEHQATYLIMAIVNYTNVCVAKCDYCSFYKLPHEKGTYLLSIDEVSKKIAELKELGGTLVGFNGGFHPKLRVSDYAALFKEVHHRHPDMACFEMTVAEFMFTCKVSKVTYEAGARILRTAGTKWITGGGAEVLDDGFRKRHSPGKYSVQDYFNAQRAILDAGMGSTATMVIGFDESLEERLNHLEQLRAFQDSVEGRLTSFLCWTYKPWNNTLGGAEISSQEYLRWLAICRIFLDNFRHIRTSVLTKNTDALAGLLFGADDFDLPTEDEVTQKAGAQISKDFSKILDFGASLGFELCHRPPFKTWHESQSIGTNDHVKLKKHFVGEDVHV